MSVEAFTIPPEAYAPNMDPAEAAFLTAVWNSMRIVYSGQQDTGLVDQTSGLKPDGSFITPDDIRSEKVAQAVFSRMLRGVPFRGEEGTVTDGESAWLRIGYDPLDGTRPRTVGAPTSVVIGSAYRPDGSVYGAMIGEPATGRIFSAFGDQRTTGRRLDLKTGETLVRRDNITTWAGNLADKGQVFLDNNQPFRRGDHDTLTAQQHMQLRAALQELGVGVLEMGTNGGHQLYVASGGDRAAAAITTARGIPEDTSAGAHLVKQSGGSVQRLIAWDGVLSPAHTETPYYDILIAANNAGTLARLVPILGGLSLQ